MNHLVMMTRNIVKSRLLCSLYSTYVFCWSEVGNRSDQFTVLHFSIVSQIRNVHKKWSNSVVYSHFEFPLIRFILQKSWHSICNAVTMIEGRSSFIFSIIHKHCTKETLQSLDLILKMPDNFEDGHSERYWEVCIDFSFTKYKKLIDEKQKFRISVSNLNDYLLI